MKTQKHIIWLVGTQRSGKTMLSKTMAKLGVKVLNIGEQIRGKMDVETLKDSENPYAPKQTEDFVQNLIEQSLNAMEHSEDNTLLIDSAPKSIGQLTLLYCSRIFDHTIIFTDDKYEERRKRAEESYSNLEYFDSREIHEKQWIEELKKICLITGIKTITLNKEGIE